ncbi:MAG: mechanosensitive ion channel family protein [Reinekea sp.]|jgi:small-conductance mechanosensitive channel
METLQRLIHWMEVARILVFLQASLTLLGGFLVARLVSTGITRLLYDQLSSHSRLLLRRGLFYLVLVLFLISALRELGFDLSVLLGAAGILSVAIGFASQTSASNLISGIFLMVERPFSIKDLIRIGNTTGEVISIDLLSVKLRTFDNLFVRIPNETVIKSEVTTLTKYPIRRLDLQVCVAYKEDIDLVKDILLDIAKNNSLCLAEPEPLIIFLGFGESSVDLQFSIWAKRENFLEVKNGMYEMIKKKFDESGIEIPFPHISLYAGEDSKPISVRYVNDDK